MLELYVHTRLGTHNHKSKFWYGVFSSFNFKMTLYKCLCESIFYILIVYLQLLASKIHRPLYWGEKKYTLYTEPYFLCTFQNVEHDFKNNCSE